jgi:alpha-1,3-rhamnosyl/mannosyltransferase
MPTTTLTAATDLRVLLDCRMASWSGIGRYSTGFARALARVDGIEIVQVVEEGATPPVPGAESVAARTHAFYPTGGLELGRIVSRVRPDITHCLHVPTPIPAPHPLVVTIHDLTPLIVPGVMPSAVRRAAYRRWNARAAKVADAVIAISHATRSDVERLFPRSVGKVHVVLEAADDLAATAPGALPAELVGREAPFLLSMGNTKPNKDLPTLLRAFATVREAHPDLRLLLVGSEAPGFVASVLGETPAARAVAFTGHVDDPTLRALYAGAAAFVFPSVYEGFGLPPLEAMMSGAAVVCSDAASLPEVVGDAALLFRAGDASACAAAVLRALDEPGLRARLVAAGAERSRLFSWDRTAAETVRVYRALLERFGTRR